MLSREERNRRRALLVRRNTARRISEAQREIWRRKRESLMDAANVIEDDVVGSGDILADLADDLLG